MSDDVGRGRGRRPLQLLAMLWGQGQRLRNRQAVDAICKSMSDCVFEKLQLEIRNIRSHTGVV